MEFIINVNNEHRDAVAQLLRAWQKIGVIENFALVKSNANEPADSLTSMDSSNQKSISDIGFDPESFFLEHYRDLVD